MTSPTEPTVDPICDNLTPINTASPDYRAGEADGYERGWKARDERVIALENALRSIRDALQETDLYDNYAETIAREIIAELLGISEDVS